MTSNNILKSAQIPYKDPLKYCKLYVGNDANRYLLRLTEMSNKETYDVVFIGLNPSAADTAYSDKTVDYCLELAQINEWKNIAICNLISFRDPNSNNYDESNWLAEAEENLRYIAQTVKNSTHIVAFWGDKAEKINNQYRQRIFNILKNRDIYTIGFTDKEYPLHLAHRNGGERIMIFDHNKILTERLKFKPIITPQKSA